MDQLCYVLREKFVCQGAGWSGSMAYFQFSNFPVQSISVILAGRGGHKVIHKKMSLMLNETSFKLNLVNCVAIIINFVLCIQIPQNLAEL